MNKFLPPKPKEWTGELISHVDFDWWYDRVFKGAMKVYANFNEPHPVWMNISDPNVDTDCALLINIQKIEPESADDILREIVESKRGSNNFASAIISAEAYEKARKFLEKSNG